MTKFKHHILPEETASKVCQSLQKRLVDVIDLALQLKQAHWCVVGKNFRTVHLQLDEILETVREASDEIAERISTLGQVPDGRSATIAKESNLDDLSAEFTSAEKTIGLVATRLETTIQGLRESIGVVGDPDPISEDLLIGISAALEKHLWMVQSQEL